MTVTYFKTNDKVLANVGSKKFPHWVPGKIINVERGNYNRPYHVKLEKEYDGSDLWYFPQQFVITDNPRNRRLKNVLRKVYRDEPIEISQISKPMEELNLLARAAQHSVQTGTCNWCAGNDVEGHEITCMRPDRSYPRR